MSIGEGRPGILRSTYLRKSSKFFLGEVLWRPTTGQQFCYVSVLTLSWLCYTTTSEHFASTTECLHHGLYYYVRLPIGSIRIIILKLFLKLYSFTWKLSHLLSYFHLTIFTVQDIQETYLDTSHRGNLKFKAF